MAQATLTPRDAARSLFKHIDTSSAPIDLVPVLKHLSVRVEELQLVGTDGTLRQDENQWRIVLRKTMSHTGKRWQVARQLGIFLMPGRGITITQRDADRFAAELLMPEITVQQYFDTRRTWLKDALSVGLSATRDDMVRGLAWQFEVTYAAMAIRLDKLKIWASS